MKKVLIFIIVIAVLGYGGYRFYLVYKERSAAGVIDEEAKEKVETRQFVKTNAQGQTFVAIEPELQKQFGVKTIPLSKSTFTNELTAFGTVIDVSPLVATLTELNAANINLDYANREYQRVKALYEAGQNAPYKNVEVALAEVKRIEESIKGIKNKTLIQWGKEIADNKDFEAFLKPFIEGKQCLVRISLLPGQSVSNPPKTAKISIIGDNKNDFKSVFFSMPKIVDAGDFTKSFIYTIEGTNLPTGLKIEARLIPEENKISGIFIPEDAVVQINGINWAYKKINEDSFQRFPIEQGYPIKGGFIVKTGWTEKDIVVIGGAQMLLSEELKSQIKLVD